MKSDDDLNTIRTLIDRRDIYRATFARAALITGALSIFTASTIYLNDQVRSFLSRPIRSREFAFIWVVIFFVHAISLTVFSVRTGISSDSLALARRRICLNTITPSIVIAAVFTIWFFGTGYLGAAEFELVVVWIGAYGLTLISTGFFGPRSIAILGWAFLLTSIAAPILRDRIDYWTDNVPVVLMGVTFGVYHVLFAAFNWRRGSSALTQI